MVATQSPTTTLTSIVSLLWDLLLHLHHHAPTASTLKSPFCNAPWLPRSEVTCGFWSPRWQPGSPQDPHPLTNTHPHTEKAHVSKVLCIKGDPGVWASNPNCSAGDHHSCEVTGDKWERKTNLFSPTQHKHTEESPKFPTAHNLFVRINPHLSS